jgi:tRNA A-37 threonylcarbamoyl transferase component Bud32
MNGSDILRLANRGGALQPPTDVSHQPTEVAPARIQRLVTSSPRKVKERADFGHGMLQSPAPGGVESRRLGEPLAPPVPILGATIVGEHLAWCSADANCLPGHSLAFLADYEPQNTKLTAGTPLLGRGSTGNVSLVRSKLTGDLAALKVMRHTSPQTDAYKAAVEFRAMSEVASAFVVAPYHLASTEDSSYLLMQYVPGISLAEHVNPIATRQLHQLLYDVLVGLGHMHAAGYAHSDVKAANLMLTDNGRGCVIDLGEAQERPNAHERLADMVAAVEACLVVAESDAVHDLKAMAAWMRERFAQSKQTPTPPAILAHGFLPRAKVQ